MGGGPGAASENNKTFLNEVYYLFTGQPYLDLVSYTIKVVLGLCILLNTYNKRLLICLLYCIEASDRPPS